MVFRYSHEEIVDSHLDIMKFFLKEGDLYLSWARCKELWDTLVDNPSAIDMDKDKIFVWFETCITDLEPETQMELFNKKLLSMNAQDTSKQSFECFKKFFENSFLGGVAQMS